MNWFYKRVLGFIAKRNGASFVVMKNGTILITKDCQLTFMGGGGGGGSGIPQGGTGGSK